MPALPISAEPDLTKEQRIALFEAIPDAFSMAELDRLLYLRMEQKLAQISLGASGDEVITMLLQWLERTGRVHEFVAAAVQQNDRNKKLRAVAKELGLVADAPPKARLQRMLNQFVSEFDMSASLPQTAQFERMLEAFARELALRPAPQQAAPQRTDFASSYADPTPLLSWLTQASQRVCLIEVNGRVSGTGFLIGSDLVLTAYHVVMHALTASSLDAVTCRFDYRIEAGLLTAGEVVRLSAETPCLHAAAHERIDLQQPVQPNRAQQSSHALLKLAQPVGEQRGWYSLNALVPLEKGTPVYIVHHPQGGPLKLSMPPGKLHRINREEALVEYIDTMTSPGSSGALVFDNRGNPLALHFAGRKNVYPPHGIGLGIPLTVIRDQLLAANVPFP